MSLRGTIRRSDNGPLGTEEDIKRCLADAFPGVRFEYQAGESPSFARAHEQLPLLLRFWLSIFGTKTRYPNYYGYFESGNGGAVEFYFPAEQPVRQIAATSYGRTAGLDGNFDRLFAATGWKIVYPRF
jgi:hypothetical protein